LVLRPLLCLRKATLGGTCELLASVLLSQGLGYPPNLIKRTASARKTKPSIICVDEVGSTMPKPKSTVAATTNIAITTDKGFISTSHVNITNIISHNYITQQGSELDHVKCNRRSSC